MMVQVVIRSQVIVAILGDKVAGIGDLGEASGKQEIDLDGLAVAPGFINMLSWAIESLIEDGRSMSNIKQGCDTRSHGRRAHQWVPLVMK